MKVLLVHDEMLNETLPAFRDHADATRVFVLDPAFINAEGWSLKRIQFVVDCVAEIAQVRVFHGALRDVLRTLNATEVVTQQTPNRAIQGWISEATNVKIHWIDEPAFADFDGKLTRFTAYWKSIAPHFFSREDLQSEEQRGRAGKSFRAGASRSR